MNEQSVCDDANQFVYGTGSRPWKENWYRNHFSLPDEQLQLFEDLFDIDLWMSVKIL